MKNNHSNWVTVDAQEGLCPFCNNWHEVEEGVLSLHKMRVLTPTKLVKCNGAGSMPSKIRSKKKWVLETQ